MYPCKAGKYLTYVHTFYCMGYIIQLSAHNIDAVRECSMSGDADLHVIIIRRIDIGLISLHRHRRQTANRQYEPFCAADRNNNITL